MTCKHEGTANTLTVEFVAEYDLVSKTNSIGDTWVRPHPERVVALRCSVCDAGHICDPATDKACGEGFDPARHSEDEHSHNSHWGGCICKLGSRPHPSVFTSGEEE